MTTTRWGLDLLHSSVNFHVRHMMVSKVHGQFHKFDGPMEEATRRFEEAMDVMTRYSWPGNVRELENVIERTVILAKRDLIEISDLPPNLKDGTTESAEVKLSLHENERLYILKTLAECNWNKKLAASVLGINRSSLYSKLKKYDIGRSPVN